MKTVAIDIDKNRLFVNAKKRAQFVYGGNIKEGNNITLRDEFHEAGRYVLRHADIKAVLKYEKGEPGPDSPFYCDVMEGYEGLIKGIFVFAVTIGEIPDSGDEESLEKRFYRHTWESSFVEAAIEEMKGRYIEPMIRGRYPSKRLYLSWTLGPGFFSMGIEKTAVLLDYLGAEEIGLTVREDYTMIPDKSSTGIMLLSDRELDLKECAHCEANKRGCRFCAVMKKRKKENG